MIETWECPNGCSSITIETFTISDHRFKNAQCGKCKHVMVKKALPTVTILAAHVFGRLIELETTLPPTQQHQVDAQPAVLTVDVPVDYAAEWVKKALGITPIVDNPHKRMQ